MEIILHTVFPRLRWSPRQADNLGTTKHPVRRQPVRRRVDIVTVHVDAASGPQSVA
jgi:hypothetical protein